MDEDAENSVREGPGQRLKTAREARGLAVVEVARTLRLDRKVIRALEGDDFSSLPAPIFIKGYLNAYCRLLNLPAQECISEYERATGAVTPPPLVISRGTGDEVAASGSRVVLVSWMVALIVVVMVVLWWYAHPRPFEPIAAPVAKVSVPPLAVEPAAPRVDAPVEQAVVPAQVTAAGQAAGDAPVGVPTRVRLEYEQDSWTEIVDATGERLYFDLARAGRVVEVEGQPPLMVFLGNSPAVRIRVDGIPFDQSRFNRTGNVARFRLGRE